MGYILNHFAVPVNNLRLTMHFYSDLLGMRHVFTFAASEEYSIPYMGDSHGSKTSTVFQSGAALYAENDNIEGLPHRVSALERCLSCPDPTDDHFKYLHPYQSDRAECPGDVGRIGYGWCGVKLLNELEKIPTLQAPLRRLSD